MTAGSKPASAAGHATTRVFFRDDDMGVLLEPLAAVMRLLREERVPCSYEAVPEALTDDVARMALAEKEKAPDLIAFHQHGLRHSRMVDGALDYAEFDGGRTRADQERDLALGRELLQQKLGAAFDGDFFTPPCHKYDVNTVQALEALGFLALSAGVQTGAAERAYYVVGRAMRRVHWLGKRVSYHGGKIAGTKLTEVSTCIDFDLEEGQPCRRSVDELWEQFLGRRRRLAVVGVNLHHASYVDRGKIDVLRAFVHRLRDTPGVELCSMKQTLQSVL